MSTKLPYLDCVLQEVLRMNILGPALDRVCSKSDGYSLEPYSDFIIPPGMTVFVPSYALVHDEKYFSTPWTFNPDRFSENSSKISFPFGCGPRTCLGERLALIILKTAIIKVLKDFRVSKSEKTPEKLTINYRAYMLQYNEDLIVDFIKDQLVQPFTLENEFVNTKIKSR